MDGHRQEFLYHALCGRFGFAMEFGKTARSEGGPYKDESRTSEQHLRDRHRETQEPTRNCGVWKNHWINPRRRLEGAALKRRRQENPGPTHRFGRSKSAAWNWINGLGRGVRLRFFRFVGGGWRRVRRDRGRRLRSIAWRPWEGARGALFRVIGGDRGRRP